jgi:hypothetical protein
MEAGAYLKLLAEREVPITLFNSSYGMYVFVSNDKKGGDHVVEAHGAEGEARNSFVLEDCGDGTFRLRNPTYGDWVFVSNDKIKGDNVVEAHGSAGEARNRFQFVPVDGSLRRFKIFSPSYGKWIFVSNDRMGRDHVIEAHSPEFEERNVFDIILPDAQAYTLKNLSYDLSRVRLSLTPPVHSGAADLRNEGDTEASVPSTISTSVTETTNWSTKWGIKIGVKTKVKTGIPMLVNGEVELSAEASYESTEGGAITTTRTLSHVITARVPPRSVVRCEWALNQHQVTVPYTATLVLDFGGTGIDIPVEGVFESVSQSELYVNYRQPTPL